MKQQLEEHGEPHESHDLRRRNSHHAMRVEKYPHRPGRNGRPETPVPNEDDDISSASGSGSSSKHVGPLDGTRKGHRSDELMTLHQQHESAAVLQWEERIERSREAGRQEREKDPGPIGGIKID
jgi:hypothetical protein